MAEKSNRPAQFERPLGWSPSDPPSLAEHHWEQIRPHIEPWISAQQELLIVRHQVARAIDAYLGLLKAGANEGLASRTEMRKQLERFQSDALRLAETVAAMEREARERLRYEIDFPHVDLQPPEDFRTPAEDLSDIFSSADMTFRELAEFASLAAERVELESRDGRPPNDSAAHELGRRCESIWLRHTNKKPVVLTKDRGGPSPWEQFLGSVINAAGADTTPTALTDHLKKRSRPRGAAP